jgi:heme-degrading monooxygenase HmoA
MELVQQVTVQVESSKLGDIRGLMEALETHRRDLRGRRGFVNMQITRSTESGGNVLVGVQTRWRDENSFSDYAAGSENAAAIVERRSDITVPGSVQVRRVEAVDTGEERDANVVYERLGIALGVPLVIVGVGLAFIYALSRVYLELESSAAATTLSAGVAVLILLGCWYFASNAVPRLQYASAVVVVAVLLLGGTVWAQVSEGPHVEEPHVEGSPTPDGPGPGPGPEGPVILLDDNVVLLPDSDARNPVISVAGAGTEQTIPVENVGNALHNLHIEAAPGAGFAVSFCTVDGDAPCTDPARMRGGQEGTITFTLAAGTYAYRCDFHTAEMVGEITVQ